MLYVAQQEMGMGVVWADPDEEEEELEDVLDDLEDVWMRNPAPPEWAEATGLLQDAAASTTNGGSSSNSSNSTVQDPARSIPTMSWQQLQQLLQEQQPQQLVVLQVETGDDEAPARPLPDSLPWADAASQQQQGGLSVQHASLQLQQLDRQAAAAWQQGSTVAVVDTGHHSCLAAAIRLSAVYRLPSVVLLQLEQ
ncbi:hypothetical protein OEZ86_005839 [Tetradesmus obliquus]|nr:hypothetical protein OEZ86_005839 [Tetradesmus obliquus]